MLKEHPTSSHTRPSAIKLALFIAGGSTLGLALIVFVLFMMGLAHRGFDITYENRTSNEITVFVDGEFEASIPPNASRTFGVYNFHWDEKRLVEAKNSTRGVLFSANLSKEDWKNLGYRIVVTEATKPVEGQ